MKKKLSLLLAILTILSSLTLLPATAAQKTDALAETGLSQGDYDYVLLGSDAYITDCRATGSVTLPTTLGGYSVYGTKWSANARSFSSVTVPAGIRDIQGSFNSPNLTSVKFLDSDPFFTGNVFGYCSQLTSVTFGSDWFKNTNGVIWCNNMDQNEIVGCLGGTSGTIAITERYHHVISNAFDGCSKLTAATISNGVAYLGADAFINCNNLKTYTVYSKDIIFYDHAIGYRLNGSNYEKLDGVVINGYKGSTAETYASQNNFTFKEITTEAPVVTKMQAVSEGVQLTWKPVEGFSKYAVFWKAPNYTDSWKRIAVISGTSCIDKTIPSGTARLYTLRGVDASGRFVGNFNSDGWLFSYYAAPTVVKVTNSAYSNGSFIFVKHNELSNSSEANDNDICVLYRKESGKSWTQIAEYKANAYNYINGYTFYHDAKAVAGKTYYYYARIKNAKTNVFYSAASKTVTYKHTAAPRITKMENVNGGIKLNWTKVSGAAKYRVFILSSGKWVPLATVTGVSFTDKKVKNAGFKTYTVRALNKSGKFLGGFSTSVGLKELSSYRELEHVNAWIHVYYPPITVKKVTKAAKGANVYFTTPNCGGSLSYSFLVYRKDGKGSFRQIAAFPISKTRGVYNDRTAVKGKTYTYEVRCYIGSGKKDLSISSRINRKSIKL